MTGVLTGPAARPPGQRRPGRAATLLGADQRRGGGTALADRHQDPPPAADVTPAGDPAPGAGDPGVSPAATTGGTGGPVTPGGDGHGPGGGGEGGTGAAGPRAPWYSPTRLLRPGLLVAALVPMAAVAFVVIALLTKAWPAIRYNGAGFFTRTVWDPGSFYGTPVTTGGVPHPPGASYGVLPLIVGTLESSAIALVLAVPIGVAVALVVVHRLPPRLSNAVGMCLEVLAGVPSVVIGLWGVLTLGPWLTHDITPFIARNMPDVPVLDWFRGPISASGEGLLPSGIVLGAMVLPIIAATSRDLFRQVPRDTIDGAVGLGMTDAEVLRAVSFPWVRTGIIGAAVLGLGRALGETIAVAMVSGSVLGVMPHNIYQTFSTIAATIVTQLDSAFTDATGLAVKTLAEAGLVLIVITLLVNVGARLLVRRVAGTALPVGRGI